MFTCVEFLAEFGDNIDEAASPDLRAHLEERFHEFRRADEHPAC
jgi:hypothetical protein